MKKQEGLNMGRKVWSTGISAVGGGALPPEDTRFRQDRAAQQRLISYWLM